MDETVATTNRLSGAAAQSTLIFDKFASTLISEKTQANYAITQRVSETVSKGLSDTTQAATNAVVLGLSTYWLSISAVKAIKNKDNTIEAQRKERKNLFSLRLGDFYMPLSQTFNLRAKKRLNVCSLVDGIDVIQQTRHEAKMIDCSLRLTLRKNQPNLEIGVVENKDVSQTDLLAPLNTFAQFLSDLYENDAVFKIDNQVINDVFNVEYALISEYDFLPQVGRSTFQFNFTLTEVKISNDTLTLDQTQIKQ